ncbi:MAG: DinB family protein [Bryobacteraceae bacterium]
MKKWILPLILSVAAPLSAGSLTQGERDFAMSNLHASRKQFLDSITDLSEAQWKFKPAPDRWSIAEVAEHLILTEGAVFNIATEKLMKSEAVTGQPPATREQDEEVLARLRDRSKKATASESITPTGRWPTPEASATAFKKDRDRSIAYIAGTQDDLRAHRGKTLDAYQYFLLLAGHTERHVAQINEVKADPNYPRK